MLGYTCRRLLLALPLLAGLCVLTFVYVRLIPGDPVTAMLGVNSDPELVAELRHRNGLDRPWWTQLGDWLGGLPQGDLGRSFRNQHPIAPIVVDRIPATLQLAVASLLLSLTIALPAGIVAGRRPGSRTDKVVTSATLLGLAIPGFWLGTLLMMLLALRLGLLPSQGYVPFSEDPLDSLRLTILPALTLGLAISPYLARLTRAAVMEARGEPYVPYARSKGLPERRVAFSYLFRNALPSLVSAIGLTVGFLLAGSIIVEELFNWPGTGRLIVRAVTERDYAMVQAMVLVYGVVFVVVNLIAELAQAALDPRVRLR
jgi:peptide/nickel transport system permease protein